MWIWKTGDKRAAPHNIEDSADRMDLVAIWRIIRYSEKCFRQSRRGKQALSQGAGFRAEEVGTPKENRYYEQNHRPSLLYEKAGWESDGNY